MKTELFSIIISTNTAMEASKRLCDLVWLLLFTIPDRKTALSYFTEGKRQLEVIWQETERDLLGDLPL